MSGSQPPLPRLRFAPGRGQAVGLLVLGNVIWAGTYTAGKVALKDLSPIELSALRFTIATVILSPALVAQWPTIRGVLRERSLLATLAQLTLLGWVLNKVLEYTGLSLSTAVDVALLIATESIFTAVLSWVMLHERISRAGVAALGLGAIGAYLVVARGLLPDLTGQTGVNRIIGDVLVILSLGFEAGYSIRGKSLLSRWPPLLTVSLTLAASLLFWVPAGLVSVWLGGLPHLSGAGWLGVLYMAVFATVIAYWLWFRGLAHLGGAEAALFLFLQPLGGALIAIALLHERLTWATVVGGALILASLALVVRGERLGGAVLPEAIGESVP